MGFGSQRGVVESDHATALRRSVEEHSNSATLRLRSATDRHGHERTSVRGVWRAEDDARAPEASNQIALTSCPRPRVRYEKRASTTRLS